MDYEFIIYDKPEDGIARITLNRPEVLNAMHLPMAEELYAAAKSAAEDDTIAVLIYRGAGRAFCSGRDFKYSGRLQTQDPDGWFAWRRRWKGVGEETWLFPKATIAQVHGHALGGGHNLAVTCDITIASEDARFGFPEARYGVLAGDQHVWNWLIGPKKTKEYLFTGRNFDAKEALMIGLINQVVPSEDLEKSVLTMARDVVVIERHNPGYIRAVKEQINSRHLEISNFTSVNRRVLEQSAIEAEYNKRAKESTETFYKEVDERGMDVALKKMHSGYSSSK